MSISNRMDYIEELYHFNEGNIHHIMNKYDLDGDDFDYLMNLKAHYCGWD